MRQGLPDRNQNLRLTGWGNSIILFAKPQKKGPPRTGAPSAFDLSETYLASNRPLFLRVRMETTISVRKLSGTEMMAGWLIGSGALAAGRL